MYDKFIQIKKQVSGIVKKPKPPKKSIKQLFVIKK